MILEPTLFDVAKRQRKALLSRERGIPREGATGATPAGFVRVITGVRRCGKSTLMHQRMSKNFFFLNFESPLLVGLSLGDAARLDRVIAASGARNLYFDEIQCFPQWELYVRQKLDEGFRVTVTGSNASLLNHELGTKLTGRHLQEELFPFSYSEALAFRKAKHSPRELTKFLHHGGFPEFLKTPDERIPQSLFGDILERDIALRHGIKEWKAFQGLAGYLMANIGSRVSASKLRQVLQVKATATLLQWFGFLEDSYLMFFVPKFSYSGKAIMVNPRKVYSVDLGLRHSVVTPQGPDDGRSFENLVFLRLRRKYKEVFYFAQEGECDFVVVRKQKPLALIQATTSLTDINYAREIRGLQQAMKFFGLKEGFIVVLEGNEDAISVPEGRIRVIPFQQMAHFDR